jgi:uncharacterized protein (DUF2141 family)
MPDDDSVGVGTGTIIEVQFSEAMDRRSVEEAVFISPKSGQLPKFRWHKNVLEIRLIGGLRKDRTYVVTVGQASADEWRNRMLASMSFRFATGPVVNQGELSGRVLWSAEHVGQAFAWAYDLGVSPEPDFPVEVPNYVTQPDAEGHFQFPGLGPGMYRVFAFLDADQNQSYTAGTDPLAVPYQDGRIDDEQMSLQVRDLKGVVRDTSAPVMTAIRTSDQHHVLMRFDEPVSVRIPAGVSGLGVKWVYQDVDSSRVGLFTDAQESGRSYAVEIGVTDRSGNRAGVATSVRGDGTADRRPPEVLGFKPGMRAAHEVPNARLEIVFSDAMSQEVVIPFWAVTDSTLSPEGHFEWVAPNRLVFTPAEAWPLGQVILQSHPKVVKDGVGNVLDDAIGFDFTVIDSQAVGTIAGVIGPLNHPAVVEAVSLDDESFSYAMRVAAHDSTFEITGLIPGLYRISGFIDLDGNGIWARGEPKPFVPAEALLGRSDTVNVRARWKVDTQNLEAKPNLLPEMEDAP